MLVAVAAVLTAAAITAGAVLGRWQMRRALIAERAARRLTEAAAAREEAARAAAEQVLAAADDVLDQALATHTGRTNHDRNRRGDSDV